MSCRLLLSCCVLVSLCAAASPAVAEQRWEFGSDTGGWKATADCELSVQDGMLRIRSTGRDPQMVVQAASPAGWTRLRMHARFKGRLRGQVFWTTESEPATSEKRSVQFDWNAPRAGFGTYEVFFRPDAAVTSLRLDPADRKATVDVRWIAIDNSQPPRPQATPPEAIRVPEGFRVERLYSVPSQEQGSWVSLTPDPKGRLITSDQYGKLYRVTPGATEAETRVEPLEIEVGMAQGLLYAFDSLYVMVNGTKPERQGLWRVRDTDGDDKFDSAEHLRRLDGGGEHGPHAIVLSPDGQSLYVCAGNHTNPPEFEQSLVPRNWQEDQLLPRMWDAGGHAVGKMAPGGWIARVDPDGRNWTLVASGFRNEYDIAFNEHGELFTYDADMEWDIGSPWYRPTRVNHVVSGAEFGWRSGTGKWPDWYADSLGSVVNVGPGSPTGIVFGTAAKFPAKYQHALFIADWSYGIVYSVHMQAAGASYTGKAERFLSAAPLPVTDIVVHPADGAMYFTIGGRRTQSGLYRVRWVGSESTARSPLPADGAELRETRRKLEALHHSGAANAVPTAWPLLGHPDRNIRFAARIAVEHQPVGEWQERALTENDIDRLLPALIALCRNGDASLQTRIVESLGRARGDIQTEQQLLETLRVLELAFIRMGRPEEPVRRGVIDALDRLYPSQSVRVNRELSQLLIYLEAPGVARKTLDLMAAAPSQEEQIQYALWLRALRTGWSLDERREYFGWFARAAAMRGGNSFTGFLKNIRQEAIATLTDDEKQALADVLDAPLSPADPIVDLKSRPVVKKWTVADLLPVADSAAGPFDFENGRRLFAVTACYKCHRFAGQGGIVGPDLTGVAGRFNTQNLLEAIVEPGKVVSDQYQATTFVLDDGRTVTGRVANLNGGRIMVIEDMLDPGRMTAVEVARIEETQPSTTSMMPAGLLDTLTEREILDLLAYLRSGGNRSHALYQPTAAGE